MNIVYYQDISTFEEALGYEISKDKKVSIFSEDAIRRPYICLISRSKDEFHIFKAIIHEEYLDKKEYWIDTVYEMLLFYLDYHGLSLMSGVYWIPNINEVPGWDFHIEKMNNSIHFECIQKYKIVSRE